MSSLIKALKSKDIEQAKIELLYLTKSDINKKHHQGHH